MNYFLTEKTDFLHDIICPYCNQRLRIDDRHYFDRHWLEIGFCANCNNQIKVEKITEVKYYVQENESLSADET